MPAAPHLQKLGSDAQPNENCLQRGVRRFLVGGWPISVSLHRVRIQALPSIPSSSMQGVDGLHFCARQLEVEDARILLHALWAHRLGYNVAAFLHGPSQQNLGPGLAMGLGRRFHRREGEEALGLGRVAGAQGGIGLQNDAMLLAELQQLFLNKSRVELHLVDHRLYLAGLHQLLQMSHRVVGDADGLHLSLLIEVLHSLPSTRVTELRRPIRRANLTSGKWPAGLRPGPVDDIEVDIVHAQLAQGLVAGLDRSVVAVARSPDLGLQEDVSSAKAGVPKRFAHALLILVDLGCVDEAVASFQGVCHRLHHIGIGHLVGAEAHHGHDDAVVQGHTPGE
mmetsp:Transcript_116537/g.277039  ORF Transcript_116537/g.277039 Transcript_116537/m.277039 type:complete len:337 (+) Transcript_116537:112-1122(+)